jgi:hypothetical protein
VERTPSRVASRRCFKMYRSNSCACSVRSSIDDGVDTIRGGIVSRGRSAGSPGFCDMV